jgi:hypothetical protein
MGDHDFIAAAVSTKDTMSFLTKITDPFRTPANSGTGITSPLGVITFSLGLLFSTINPSRTVFPKASKMNARALSSKVIFISFFVSLTLRYRRLATELEYAKPSTALLLNQNRCLNYA